MKPKRVECSDCINFIPAVFPSFFSFRITQNAKCKLGKRVMFRKPTLPDTKKNFSEYWNFIFNFAL